jgi:hypothetical protein
MRGKDKKTGPLGVDWGLTAGVTVKLVRPAPEKVGCNRIKSCDNTIQKDVLGNATSTASRVQRAVRNVRGLNDGSLA